MRKIILALAALLLIPSAGYAQSVPGLATVVTTCGTPPSTYTAGQNRPVLQNTSGNQCSNSTGTVTGTVTTNPGPRTIVALDVATVTTGGTAVTALIAGHRSAGGFLYNPIGASINLCINEQGVASGTTSAGALTCIQPGQAYTLAPSAAAVSVVTSDSSHPFSGYGLN